MTRKIRITVNHQACVGSTMCTSTAPRVFALNQDRQSQVTDPAGDSLENILDAAQGCPVGAISMVDEETDEQLFP